jgi:hypothetical protein
LLFTPATCAAIAIVTVLASVASGAAFRDVAHAAASVGRGAGSWAAVVKALIVSAYSWCIVHRRVSFSIRRRDDTIRVGNRVW